MKKQYTKQQLIGWIAVGLSMVITCVWAFWGIIENFHEGWYFESLWPNLGMMFIQYLSPMLIFMGVTLISIFWPRFGAGLYALIALFAVWFFKAFSNTATFLIILPLIGLGAMFWFGRPQPRRLAAFIVVGFPLLALIIFGIQPALRVSRRLDDRNLGLRYLEGNGAALYWAPQGPGWPATGGSWYAAQQACQYLSEDGLSLAPAPQNVWRLPAVDEAVRSMMRHGENSLGAWSPEAAQATYSATPDKESPLWDVHSQVIYWWTATQIDAVKAYIIAYDGRVWPRSRDFAPAYLGFRCVKQ